MEFWLGSEWHPGSGHSQLSPDNATFSRWKLWLKKIINVSELPVFSWVGERRDETTMPAWDSRQHWFRFLSNLKARLWPKFWDPNHFTFLQITQRMVSNICAEICVYLVRVDLCPYKLTQMIWTFAWLSGIFFSKATRMATCGIEVLQNDICVALPVLTYLVLFVLFHCSSQQCYLQETYRELNWQSQVYLIFFQQNSSWPNCYSWKFKKKNQQQKWMRLVSGENSYY